MEIRKSDFDTFFGKPIPHEGFTIEEIEKDALEAEAASPARPAIDSRRLPVAQTTKKRQNGT
jgi:hypothetical protein